MSDIFRPTTEPARSIYDVFQNEARKRKGRTVGQWQSAELAAVYFQSVVQASKFGLKIPSIQDIETAERCASGHTDYGSKWAYGVVDAMKK